MNLTVELCILPVFIQFPCGWNSWSILSSIIHKSRVENLEVLELGNMRSDSFLFMVYIVLFYEFPLFKEYDGLVKSQLTLKVRSNERLLFVE